MAVSVPLVACNPNTTLPAVVGTPLTTPVAASRVSPAGRLPEVTDHVAPATSERSWCEYQVPTTPRGATPEVSSAAPAGDAKGPATTVSDATSANATPTTRPATARRAPTI